MSSLPRGDRLEITDLLWPLDAARTRLPVRQAEAARLLDERGQRRARRIILDLPAVGGVLDADYIDALGLRVHFELQRLEEGELAQREGLSCRFVLGDAFEPGLAIEDGRRTIVVSSGLLHHLPERELPGFFAGQERLGVAAFAHWDIAPCLWSTLGAWIFHQARMREPVSRHDGVLSARRAHPAQALSAAARAGAPGYAVEVREGPRWRPRAIDVLRPVVGVRR